ncbi:hypothetical protein Ancab_038604 [Ancistrocladus abbreviatus]
MARQRLLSCTSTISASQAGWSACYNLRRRSDHVNVIEHLGGEEQQQVSVWQKNILMGGKCQVPDFSGLIIYDSAGNIVSSSKPPSCPRPALP